jgi:ABC-type methionine transport system permease subunit
MKTQAGIAFGPPWIKVKVTVTKNRKMVLGQKLLLGIRYCNETLYMAYMNTLVGIAFGPLGVKVTVIRNRKMVSRR